MDIIKKIWNDPVWSKVISGIILAVLGLLYSVIKGLLNGSDSIPDEMSTVFGYKVNIWLAIVVMLAIWAIFGYFSNRGNENVQVTEPPFVSGFIEGYYQNQRWRWRWQWSETKKYYYVSELSIVCPICHEGLLTLGYMDYKCGKCGAEIKYSMLNTTSDAVSKQILADARKNYDYCKDFVGPVPADGIG